MARQKSAEIDWPTSGKYDLSTWSGEVEYERESFSGDRGKDKHVIVQCQIEFLYETKSRSLSYSMRTHRDASLDPNEKSPRFPLRTMTEVFHGDLFYDATYRNGDNDARRIAYIRAERKSRPSFSYSTFDPLFFYTDRGSQFGDYWRLIFENAENPSLTGSVVKLDETLLFTQEASDDTLRVKTTIDLQKGGNVTRQETVEARPKFRDVTVVDYDWEERSGVWIPREVREVREITENSVVTRMTHTKLTWVASKVNQELPDDAFSLVRLGLRQGDKIIDTRDNAQRIVEGPPFLPTELPGEE